MNLRFAAIVTVLVVAGVSFAVASSTHWQAKGLASAAHELPSPASPTPGGSAESIAFAEPNVLPLKLKVSRSFGESHDMHIDTDALSNDFATDGYDSGPGPSGMRVSPQPTRKGSITCDPGRNPKATQKFKAAISVTNHKLSDDAELFLKVTFTREIYEWSRERKSARFSVEQGKTYKETGEFRSLLPGEGYAIECELRRHVSVPLVGPFSIGWPDESVATDRSTFSVGDFQSSNHNKHVASITECSASPGNLQVGDTVELELKAKRTRNVPLTAASFIQIFRDTKLVNSYPKPGKDRRSREKNLSQLQGETNLLSHTFQPSETGLYTAYCFLHTGAVTGFTAKTRDDNATLEDYYKVLSLFLPGGGPAFDFWSEILSGYFSHLESVKSVHFCVGDPGDCRFNSTSDDGPSGTPDLEIESLTVNKSTVEPGESFTLTAKVRNSGSGASSETNLRYYRSTTSAFSTSNTEDPVNSVIGLDPSDTESVSDSLTALSGPGTYYYRTCVAPVSGESNTDNNCSTSVRVIVQVTQQGSPDLVVDAPSVSKSETQPGGRFRLSATVRNSGDARAGSAILRYYRSTDSGISARSDTEVGSDTVNSLQPSESDGESVGVSSPADLGEYYYGACVVPLTSESNTGNNCSSSRKVTVAQATTSPDLVVDSPSVSRNEVDTGGRFTVRAFARNIGDGPAPAATLRYYRSADSTITTGDVEVETDSVRSLDPSETDDERERLTAPEDAGDYYYGACVDSVTGESNTQNNCSSGVVVAVTEPVQTSVDLAFSGVPTVDDSSLDTGDSFTLSVTVLNSGSGTSAATTLRYYRSSDSTISSVDTEVGTDSIGALGPSGTEAESISLTAPSTAGTYYYGACVDSVTGESDTNNDCSSGVVVAVTEPVQTAVDLAFSGVPTVDDSSLDTGDSFTLSVTVLNSGSGTSAATTLRYYQSADSTISDSDTEVRTASVGSLGPSGTAAESVSLTAPSSAGTYYYGACVDSVTGESDTNNNCSDSVKVTVEQAGQSGNGNMTANLIVDSVSIRGGDTELEPLESFTLIATVRNDGDGASSDSILRYYQSSDSTISTDDTRVGADSVPSLSPSDTDTQGTIVLAPYYGGTYYYGACIVFQLDDPNTQINCSDGLEVTVTGSPNLMVRSISVSDNDLEPGNRSILRRP